MEGAEDEEFYVVGERVFIDGHRRASVAHFGEVEFAAGDWVGAVLDQPTGNHDGKFRGRKYFQCAPRHGILVRPRRVSRAPSPARPHSTGGASCGSSSQRSTPLPTFQHFCDTPERFQYDYEYLEEPASLFQVRRGRNQPPDNRAASRTTSPGAGAPPPPVFNFRPRRIPLKLEEEEEEEEHQQAKMVHLKKGDTVLVRVEGARELRGILRYLGPTEFADGQWAGVELDTAEGKNDGSVMNRRYFHCARNYGLFMPAARIRKWRPSAPSQQQASLETVRSTIKSPPPLASAQYINSLPWAHKPDYPSSGFNSASSPEEGRHSSAEPADRAHSVLFDDSDIELLLKQSMERGPPLRGRPNYGLPPTRPLKTRCITHTFTSSKYDGNPVVRRSVEYL